MLDDLDKDERLRLMKFICSFAWANLEIKDAERSFVHDMVERLHLDQAERDMVSEWMEVPPRAEELDPSEIPVAHRQLFLDAARAMIVADGKVDHEEAENLVLLEQLMRG